MILPGVYTDEEGNEIEIQVADPLFIATPCPGGFYHPKWVNGEWVEGKTQAEIDAIIAAQEPIPAPDRTLQEQVDLLTIMVLELGGELNV